MKNRFMRLWVWLLIGQILVEPVNGMAISVSRIGVLPTKTAPACFLQQTLSLEPVYSPLHELLQSLPKIRGIRNRLIPDYKPFQTEWNGKKGQAFGKELVKINSDIYLALREPSRRLEHLQQAHDQLQKLNASLRRTAVPDQDPGAMVIRDTLTVIEEILRHPDLAQDRPAIKKIHDRIYKLFDLNIVDPVTLLGVPDRMAIGPIAAPMLYDAIEQELLRIDREGGPKQTCNIILPADRTVESTYKAFVQLLRERPLDLSRVHFFFLDNYLDIPQRYRSRDFRAQALRDLIRPLRQLTRSKPELGFNPEHVHTMDHADAFFSGRVEDYDAAIEKLGGIDFALIGIGENSHMAFMEPIVSFFTLLAQKIKVSLKSRKQNDELFDHDYRNVPQFALSAGIGSILGAKKIVQLIATPKKRGAMLRALEWMLGEAFPSSSLRTHGNATIIASADARAKLRPHLFAHRYRFTEATNTPTPVPPTPAGRLLGPVQGLCFGWEGVLAHNDVLFSEAIAKVQAIRAAYPDIPMYVLSGDAQAPINGALEYAGIKDLFTEVLAGRPAPVALEQLKQVEMWDENDLLVVGDGIDVMPGKTRQRRVGIISADPEEDSRRSRNFNGFVPGIEALEFEPTFQFNVVNVYVPVEGPKPIPVLLEPYKKEQDIREAFQEVMYGKVVHPNAERLFDHFYADLDANTGGAMTFAHTAQREAMFKRLVLNALSPRSSYPSINRRVRLARRLLAQSRLFLDPGLREAIDAFANQEAANESNVTGLLNLPIAGKDGGDYWQPARFHVETSDNEPARVYLGYSPGSLMVSMTDFAEKEEGSLRFYDTGDFPLSDVAYSRQIYRHMVLTARTLLREGVNPKKTVDLTLIPRLIAVAHGLGALGPIFTLEEAAHLPSEWPEEDAPRHPVDWQTAAPPTEWKQLLRIARAALGSDLVPTPLQQVSPELSDAIFGNDASHRPRIFLKREDMTPIGSYKYWGALAKIKLTAQGLLGPALRALVRKAETLSFNSLQKEIQNSSSALPPEITKRLTFVAYSAGNHAQGVARAAQKLGAHAVIFAPVGAPQTKQQAILKYRAQLKLVGADLTGSTRAALEHFLRNEGDVLVSPTELLVMMGHGGAIGMGMLDQARKQELRLDGIISPLGTGTLPVGLAEAVRNDPDFSQTPLFGAEPAGAASMAQSLQEEKYVMLSSVNTIADGAKVPQAGVYAWLMSGVLKDVIPVSEDHIRAAIKLLYETEEIQTEGAGALGIAELLANPDRYRKMKDIVVVITGKNIDKPKFDEIIGKPASQTNGVPSAQDHLRQLPWAA